MALTSSDRGPISQIGLQRFKGTYNVLECVAQKVVEICVDQGKAPNEVAGHVVVQNKEAMM